MTLTVSLTQIFFAVLILFLYILSGYVSIILCEKNTTLKKYFTKKNSIRLAVVVFIAVYYLFINLSTEGESKLGMPIMSMIYAIIYSLIANLLYRRLKLKNFFDDKYYQCLTGTLLFTLINSLRAYYEIL